MSWRFKASKYKNAAPKVPKPEEWVREVNVGSYQVNGQLIKASAAFMAFNVDNSGSNLCVLPLSDTGRKPKDLPLLHAHSDLVTDFDFSPFDDALLATGSQDALIKLWNIPQEGLKEPLTTPACTLSRPQKRVENVVFHPTADFLLSTTSGSLVTLWDILYQKELASICEHDDLIYSTSWKADGTVMLTCCRDRQVRLIDPRANKVCQKAEDHTSNREALAQYLGDSHRVLTSGFDASRQRQVHVRDVRKFSQVEFSLVFDSSTGVLLPLFDNDTQMLFLAGKADNTINYYEVNDRDPVLTEGIKHTGQQSKGACLVPKRAMRVMEGEVNRILQLTANGIVPISYIVPRKSYREFHADIYPESNGYTPGLYASQWFAGQSAPVPKINLDPAHWTDKSLTIMREPLSERKEEPLPKANSKQQVKETPARPASAFTFPTTTTAAGPPKPAPRQKNSFSDETKPAVQPRPTGKPAVGQSQEDSVARPVPVRRSVSLRASTQQVETGSDNVFESPAAAPQPLKRSDSDRASKLGVNGSEANEKKSEEDDVLLRAPTTAQRRQMFQARMNSVQDNVDSGNQGASPIPKRSTRLFGRVSKYRHLHGTLMPKSNHIENIRGLDQSLPAECNGFQGNSERVAVPLSGPGGKIAILELNKSGRLPDGTLPALFNTCKVLDFAWDPFDASRLLVGCEDGSIRLWNVPEGGLTASNSEADRVILTPGSTDRITLISFHPLAKDVVAIAAADFTIRVWNLANEDPEAGPQLTLTGHGDQIFGMAWSPCGKFLSTVCKDGKVRVYSPRESSVPLAEGKGPSGVKGARIIYALEGKVIIVSGFEKTSERLIYVYKSADISQAIYSLPLDVSPTLLIPFYDEDSATLFLTGKGDITMLCYEVTDEQPFLYPLSHHKCGTVHQAVALLPKIVCQVKDVEFARFLCLTHTTVEPLAFTVPRVKSEYFQDDLFPPTRVLWEPSMTAQQWFSGVNFQAPKISLKPDSMQALSVLKESQAKDIPSPKTQTTANLPSVGETPSPFSTVSSFTKKEREKEAKLEASISARLEINLALEQDGMEGVDETEWDN